MTTPERLSVLRPGAPLPGRYVLHWMQQSQRAEWNEALNFSIARANDLNVPLLVVFGVTARFPEANRRHYRFMLEGLAETEAALRRMGISVAVVAEPPVEAVVRYAEDACLAVADRGYLRIQTEWRQAAARRIRCPLTMVEADVIVPTDTASDHEEYAAATLRRRITPLLPRFLQPCAPAPEVANRQPVPVADAAVLGDIDAFMDRLGLTADPGPKPRLRGGAAAARANLQRFIDCDLAVYDTERNDPARDRGSAMSPYLHFGQISAAEIAIRVRDAHSVSEEARAAFLEELIVRRELAVNFIRHNPAYDRYDALPEWARRTLAEHARDPRPAIYGRDRLEAAQTEDPYWNAAQTEMVLTGRMHGYMRMYWGKKVLEWTASPEEAFDTLLALNNTYELDGRDANGFAGVAWCFGKHDRGWPERPVFGKVRYMNAAGLRRKFAIDAYVARVDALRREAGI